MPLILILALTLAPWTPQPGAQIYQTPEELVGVLAEAVGEGDWEAFELLFTDPETAAVVWERIGESGLTFEPEDCSITTTRYFHEVHLPNYTDSAGRLMRQVLNLIRFKADTGWIIVGEENYPVSRELEVELHGF